MERFGKMDYSHNSFSNGLDCYTGASTGVSKRQNVPQKIKSCLSIVMSQHLFETACNSEKRLVTFIISIPKTAKNIALCLAQRSGACQDPSRLTSVCTNLNQIFYECVKKYRFCLASSSILS